jgi:hypothetical protein
MAKRISKDHTTLVLVLLDGTHRVVRWNTPVDFNQIRAHFKAELLILECEIVWAFLACGQQHQQYTGNEVRELAR